MTYNEKIQNTEIVTDIMRRSGIVTARLNLYQKGVFPLSETEAESLNEELAALTGDVQRLKSHHLPEAEPMFYWLMALYNNMMNSSSDFTQLDKRLIPVLLSMIMVIVFLISIYAAIIWGCAQEFKFEFDFGNNLTYFICPDPSEC